MKINTNNIMNALVLGSENMGQDTIVIKSSSSWKLTHEMVEEGMQEQEDIKVLFYEFKSNAMHEAYEPFLGWVKTLYEESGVDTPEEFLELCEVYPLHRSMICHYIRTEACIRKEPIVLYEKKYDKVRFMESLTNIIKYAAGNGKILLVLCKIHLAGYSTVEYLASLIQSKDRDKIALLCTYDSTVGIPIYMNDVWESLVRIVEEQNIGMIMHDKNLAASPQKEKETVYFQLVPETFERYVSLLHTMLETLAVEQALFYLEEIEFQLRLEKEEIGKEMQIRFWELYAYAYLYNGQYQNMLMVCDKVEKLGTNHLDVKFNCTYAMSLAQNYLGQEVTAMTLARTCQSIAEEMKDEDLIFLAKMLCGIVWLKGFGTVIMDVDNSVDGISEELLAEMEERGYDNHVAYFCIYGFERSQKFFTGENPEKNLKFFQKGMQIIEQNQNDKFMIEAYRKCAMMYSVSGKMEEVEKSYKKCIDVLRRIDSKEEEADIYNGLGYNSMLRENFEQANTYYNQALQIYYDLGNPVLASETLYNMGINALVAEDYKRSCECVTAAIHLLDYYGVYKPRICNRAKLYGIVAVCHFKLGNGYKTQIYLEKMERIFRHILKPDKEPVYDLWDDELFYYRLVQGLICQQDDRLEDALEQYEQAYFHMERSTGSMYVTYPLLVSEQTEILKQLGREEERKELLQKCLEFNEKKEKAVTIEKLKTMLAGRKLKKQKYKLDIDMDLEMVFSMAKRYGAERALTLKNKNIDFLSSWQEMFATVDLNEEVIVKQSMLTLKNYFGLDRILLFNIEKNGDKTVKYCDKEIPLENNTLDHVAHFFRENKSSFVVSRIDGNFEEYEEIICDFGMNTVVSMIGIPIFSKNELQTVFITYQIMYENFSSAETMLKKSDLRIFVVALRQLMNEIYRADARKRIAEMNRELKNKNMLLENIARTDSLTGLLNRQGFNKIVDEKLDYGEDGSRYLNVMYIDLDNFKYCNDTFGHDVGDLVLRLFANMFTSIIGQSGYVVRYGGDEFVVVAQSDNPDYGKEVAEDIFGELKENHAFADEISKSVGKAVSIPDNKKLSCSIGIAVDEAKHVEMISDLLKHADSSLYKVKKTTKNSYEVWQS